MSDVHTPDGISVDWVGKKIYWSDGGYNMIEVAEFDGSNRLTLFSTDLDDPRAIAVDPLSGCVLKGLCHPTRMREPMKTNLKKTAQLFQVVSEILEGCFYLSKSQPSFDS